MKLGITMLIHNKDDIQFVTELPCFLGHPVAKIKAHRHRVKRLKVIRQSLGQNDEKNIFGLLKG